MIVGVSLSVLSSSLLVLRVLPSPLLHLFFIRRLTLTFRVLALRALAISNDLCFRFLRVVAVGIDHVAVLDRLKPPATASEAQTMSGFLVHR